jgi:RNA-directed DNA polymerase
LKGKVSDLLVPGNKGSWPDVRDRLNSLLAGWSAYFGYGSLSLAYRAADHHVVDRVRHFLAKRHKEQNSGTSVFSRSTIFSELGVRQLRRVPPVSRRGLYNEATRKAGCGKSARPV